ncbi:hypothetical protein PV327_011310 [Microctonus hyperodae]|uniref:Spondin-like TSP1 domain-containing protein n=1 Tax=Microctonus hyperodae TaxID=165561 RepID=A0AA39FKY1_MICHY|nr:hypothetical protein PV327_011310 [Microctonus hyperodae]
MLRFRINTNFFVFIYFSGLSRDCKISDWGAWSACSRSCGVGETQRTRKVTVKPRRGGKQCPPLKETKWCGSVTPCNDNNVKPIVDVFSW